MTIGQRIKEKRKELKISADELAKRLNKDRSTIYRYENGDIENLPLDILNPIAAALDTTPAYLMGWENTEKNNNIIADADFHTRILADDDALALLRDYYSLPDEHKHAIRQLVQSLKKKET